MPATWKKVIVSGSTANLANVQVDGLTSGQVVIGGGSSNLSTTAINGSGTIVATTNATGLVHSGSFSGSFSGNGAGLTGVTASSANALTAGSGLSSAGTYDGSVARTFTVDSGSLLPYFSSSIFTRVSGDITINSSTGVSAIGASKVTSAMIVNDTITNDDINSAAAIVDTKLATISTAGKVSNSATTATANNNASTIVARDASGNFFAGTITANLTGTSSVATLAQTANTASYVVTAQTASFVTQAVSASFATSASYAASVNNLTNAITNNADNRILTATNTGTINGESNLSFDGTTLSVTGNATLTGNLTVAGTASFTNTDNLTVRDKFILINSGSTTLADSGWITQYNAAGSGSVFYLDAGTGNDHGPYGRFATAFDTLGTTTSPTVSEYVVTAKINQASAPSNAVPPTWGTGSNGGGNMWVTSTGDIYIYS